MEQNFIMYMLVAIFVGKNNMKFPRAEYFLTEDAANEKMSFFKNNVDNLVLVKIYGMLETGEIQLCESFVPEKVKSAFQDMELENPFALYVPLGGIVYIATDTENTSGWYQKKLMDGKSVYTIENDYDKKLGNYFSASAVENNTKFKTTDSPKITYVANIDDEGILFDSFQDLLKKFNK